MDSQMPTTKITQAHVKQLETTKAQSKVKYYDQSLSGFLVVHYPTGRISFCVRTRIKGKDTLQTIGRHPALTVHEARDKARTALSSMFDGVNPKQEQARKDQHSKAMSVTLRQQLEKYLKARNLKSGADYHHCIKTYMKDWIDKPIRDLSRMDYEDVYLDVKNRVSQATATKMNRYLSAILNWTKADEVHGERLLKENVTDVIKEKRYSTAVKPKESYLKAGDVEKLLDYLTWYREHQEWKPDGVNDRGAAYVLLLLYTGLRKSEALSLRWEDLNFEDMVFTVKNTKNEIDHHVPMSPPVSNVFRKLAGSDAPKHGWVFPSETKSGHWSNPNKSVANIVKASGVKFGLHDLRRTFATHARLLGMDYDLVRRSINHKSGEKITDRYIVERIELIRPVFNKIADGFENYSSGDHTGQGYPDEYYQDRADTVDIVDETHGF